MVTVKKAREILGEDSETMTDEEIQHLIDYISAIGVFVIEKYFNEKVSE